MMSVELLLDAESDARIRRQWDVLTDAGLPSQGRHTGESNAPHITLLAAASINANGFEAVTAALPLQVHLGGVLIFGQPPRSLVLTRGIVVTTDLIVLHRLVDALAQQVVSPAATALPGRWTPHLTLASRLTPTQLAQSIEVLGASELWGNDEQTVTLSRARHWDGDRKIVTEITPPA